MPPIESVLEGRHFFAVGFWEVRTIGMAHIIVEMDSQEYNMYFRTIGCSPDPPIESVREGRHFFVVGFWRVCAINMASIIVEMHS
jgi:hypothetical protein